MGPNRSDYTHLLEAGRLGPLELRNRIVMPAMDQNLCTEEGIITEDVIAHYEDRAAGGAAALILETSAVAYPVGATSRVQPSLSTDDCIPGLRELADRVHAKGAKLLVQMCHHGKTASVDIVEGREMLVPSLPMPDMNLAGMATDLTMPEIEKLIGRLGGMQPLYTQATTDDLAWVVAQFVEAAKRVQQAGCDGVEIHAAHGYLISSFLSPCWNRRDDEYGGDVEGRSRLLAEIVEAVKAATPDQFALIVRIDGSEFRTPIPGITPALAAQHARIAEEAGADAIHVSAIGSPDSGVAFTDGPLPWQPLQYRELAKAVKETVSVPVIAVGRINPKGGDQLIGEGSADFVAMGRQLLADPDLPQRLMMSTPELVRPCINCFVCVAQNFWNDVPHCAVNARLGRRSDTELSPAPAARRVVVIGGGPGGMEAARIAAERGHTVTLIERAPYLGGTARFSSLTTPINGEFVAYQAASLREMEVKIQLGVEATAAEIRQLEPDVIVIATGASRDRPDVPGADADHVLSGDDLRGILTGGDPLASRKLGLLTRVALWLGHRVRITRNLNLVRSMSKRWMPLGTKVTIIGGGLVGIELAEFLAERGREVTVLEAGPHLGTEMAHPRRWRALHESRELGARFITGAELVEVTPTEVVYRIGDDEHRIAAESVIIASGVRPNPTLADELESSGLDVHVIGDAAEVGYIEGAVRAGYDLALTI